ncbi:MAG: aminodeoxychorismate synthase component I [Bacteroidetes bacterium]|nr:aminodeoxychorismate synthase component I [Bacteroidota bacterium]MCL5026534.1 aminodeoxychorismate synthase component I [Chloroflexota bacterium]
MGLLVEEIPGALTPYACFAAFRDASHPVLLDSGIGHERLGRYSYLSADPRLTLRSKGSRVHLSGTAHDQVVSGDPFALLQRLLCENRTEAMAGLPPFQGGAVGYFAYELGHHLERLPYRAVDDLHLPEMYLGFYDWVLAHDHQMGRSYLMVCYHDDVVAARERTRRLRERLEPAPPQPPDEAILPAAGPLRSAFTRAAYLAAVARVKEHIAAGDIYQACLSQRFQARWPASPWELYRRLRQVNPAPFAAYLGFQGAAVVSASPEQFLKVEGRRVETRPMKGTRPRGGTPARDRALADELQYSEKDRAENVMIVDLLRNDLGRVCRVGSVHVPELWVIEQYPTVWQMVSTVQGELAEGRDAVDLLRACFPGGSITGAPKIRAIEIIDDLEPTQRSVYCGAIGYIGYNGNMNTNVAIRTLIIKDDQVYFQVGGGIVADSDPEAEYQETLDKARGSILALQGVAHAVR